MAKHTVARAGLVAGPLPLFGITLAAKTRQLQVQGHAAGRLAAHQLGEMYGPQGLQAAFQAQLDSGQELRVFAPSAHIAHDFSGQPAAGHVQRTGKPAGQRGLAQALARKLGPEGIHVSYVIVDGVIDIPRTRQMLPDRPDEFFLNADEIAQNVYFLTCQDRSAWTFELDLRPFGEKW